MFYRWKVNLRCMSLKDKKISMFGNNVQQMVTIHMYAFLESITLRFRVSLCNTSVEIARIFSWVVVFIPSIVVNFGLSSHKKKFCHVLRGNTQRLSRTTVRRILPHELKVFTGTKSKLCKIRNQRTARRDDNSSVKKLWMRTMTNDRGVSLATAWMSDDAHFL